MYYPMYIVRHAQTEGMTPAEVVSERHLSKRDRKRSVAYRLYLMAWSAVRREFSPTRYDHYPRTVEYSARDLAMESFIARATA